MSKFICNNPTDGGMCHLDAEHYGPCIPSQPASASSTPEPKDPDHALTESHRAAGRICPECHDYWNDDPDYGAVSTCEHNKPVAPQPAPSSPTKQVPERTISDECRWCAEGEPEWSPDAKCWIHRRPNLDKRCLRKRLSPVGERADAEDAAESIQVGGSVAPSSPSPQRAKCDGCGADYDPKFAETTCIVCDGIIQPTVTPVESPQRAENGRIPHEGSGIYAPGENCHCKIYGHDSACALGKRCLCAYCVSFAQPTPESTGLEEQAREIVADVFPSMDRECALRYTKLIAERLAHISQEKDARITQLEKELKDAKFWRKAAEMGEQFYHDAMDKDKAQLVERLSELEKGAEGLEKALREIENLADSEYEVMEEPESCDNRSDVWRDGSESAYQSTANIARAALLEYQKIKQGR